MHPIHHRPIYTKFYALVAMGFLFGVVYGTFSLALPILAENIIVNLALLGVIFALPELAGVFLDIPIGAFAERFGRRHTIFYSGVLLIISAVLFITIRHPALFVLALIFYEIATQSFIIPAGGEVMALSPGREPGRFNGISEGLHNLGFSVGPIVAGMLLSYAFSYAFIFAAAIAFIMLFVSLYYLPREKKSENLVSAAENVWRRDRIFLAGFREFRALGFTGIFLGFLFFVFAIHWGFIALMEPLYINALGFSSQYIGLIYAGFTIPFAIVSYLIGRYIDRRGAKGVIVGGLLLIGLSTIGFSQTQSPKLLFIFSLISGVGDAFLLPGIMSILDRLSSYHKKAEIEGVWIFTESLGYFLAPLFAGVASGVWGFANTFLILGVFFVILTIGTIFIPIRVASDNRPAKLSINND